MVISVVDICGQYLSTQDKALQIIAEIINLQNNKYIIDFTNVKQITPYYLEYIIEYCYHNDILLKPVGYPPEILDIISKCFFE